MAERCVGPEGQCHCFGFLLWQQFGWYGREGEYAETFQHQRIFGIRCTRIEWKFPRTRRKKVVNEFLCLFSYESLLVKSCRIQSYSTVILAALDSFKISNSYMRCKVYRSEREHSIDIILEQVWSPVSLYFNTWELQPTSYSNVVSTVSPHINYCIHWNETNPRINNQQNRKSINK